MSIAEFYQSIKKNAKANTELNQLYKKPVPESSTQMPKCQVFNKNIYQQGDVLFMPTDGKFKFMVVICDLYDGTIDAEPITEVNNIEALRAINEIYKRDYLKFPKFITFDKGHEFKGNDIIQFFKNNGSNVKYALTARHRQLANVERANQKIGTILFKRMAAQELLTGEPDSTWVEDLQPLIKVLNEHKKQPLTKEISDLPIVDEYTGKLLKIGQKVRILLDYPINNTNHARLNGTFRSTDIRWSPQVYTITELLLKPSYPPGYLTDKDDMVFRTKNQLSIVKNNEKEPDPKFNRGQSDFGIISEILDKKIENRKTLYKVRWKGYKASEATWVNILDRTNDLKLMKREFNEQNP